MAWEPDTEEIRLSQNKKELDALRAQQVLNSSSINNNDISNNMGSLSGQPSFSIGQDGDVNQEVSNDFGAGIIGAFETLGSYFTVKPSATNEPTANCATVKYLKGAVNGQKVTLKPQATKSLCLIHNPRTNPSTTGNLFIGSDITLTDTELITLRFTTELLYTDYKGAWIVESTGNGSGNSTSGVLKDPVKVATTANVTNLTFSSPIDGIAMTVGDRFLVKDQTTQADNGIYIWANGSASTRSSDMSGGSVQKEGTMTYTQDGNTQAEILYAINIGGNNITIGTSDNTWGEIGSGSGGGSGTIKSPCKYATTANITLSGEQSIDGTATSTSRVLVKNQTTASQNGIYVTATGAWARSTDMATASTIEGGTMVYVTDGTVNGDNLFGLTTEGTVIVGTTNQAWANLTVSGANTTLSNLALTTSINSNLTMQNGFSIANLERVAFNTRTSSGIAGSISYNGTDIFAKGSGAEVNLTSGSTNWSDITIDVDKNMNQKQLTNLNAVVSTSNITATGFIFNTSSGTKPKITSSANSTVMGFWVDGFESASVTYDTFGGNKDGEITVNGSSGIGARFRMYNSSTPSGGLTTAGRMYFDAKDSAGNADTFAMIEAGATNYASGSEQGEIDFQVRRGGTNTESVAIINQTGFHPPINNTNLMNLGSASTPWNYVYGTQFSISRNDGSAVIDLYRDNTSLGNNEMGRIIWYGDRTGVNKDSLAWIRTNILDYTQGDAYMGFDVAVNGLQDTFIELYGDDPKVRLHKPADLVRQAVPTNPASNATGKLFYNSVDNHLSFRKRNDANNAFETVDLEGGGGSQTPWTSNIDANSKNLNNLVDINFSSGASMTSNALGVTMVVPTGDYWFFKIGSTNEFYIDSTLFRIYNQLDMNNQKIVSVGYPTQNTDVATKLYVDANSGGSGADLSLSNLNATGEAHFSNPTLSNVTSVSVSLPWANGVRQTFNPSGTNSGLNVGADSLGPSSAVNGDIYYNSNSNKFRVRENSSWVDMVGGSSGGVSNPVNTSLNMATTGTSPQNITRINTAFFDGDDENAHYINGNTNGLDYNVDDTDEEHRLIVDGVVKFKVGNSNATLSVNVNANSKSIYNLSYTRYSDTNVSGLDGTIWYYNGELRGQSSNGGSFIIEGSGSGPTLSANQTWTGTNTYMGTNATTVFKTNDNTSTAYTLQLIQNANSPSNYRTLANIDFMAENSSSNDEIYARISASSPDITNGTEDGQLDFGVVSAGTLVSAINIEGGTYFTNGAKIGFFGVTPILRPTVSTSASNSTIVTALKNLGLFN